MTSISNYVIDPLSSGDGLTEINEMIGQVQTALNSLSSRVDNVNTKSCCLRHGVPTASGTTVGSLVYYDTANSNFAPALAELMATPGNQGESVESPKARVEGMIVAINTAGTSGTLLTGGYWESATAAQSCLGTSATSGTYYLSPTAAGHATKDPGAHLRQPVLTYYGNGKFSLTLFYLAHDNHFHASALITGTWTAAATMGTELGITPPAGATFGYNHTTDASFNGMGEMSQNITALFYLGSLVTGTSSFIIDQGYIWTKLASAPASGSVRVFNHFPFAYGSAVVRDVISTNSALKVTQQNGTCLLTPADYVAGTTARSALAVSALSGNTMLYTPVISDASAGPGIIIDKNNDGSVVVSASNLVGRPIDAYGINHSGTAPSSNGLFTFFMFPKNRNSEMVITLPVQDVSNGTTMNAVVWGISAESAATLSISMYFVGTPTGSIPVNIPAPGSTPDLSTTMTLSSITGKFTYCEAAAALSFQGDGMLVAVLSLNSPATDILMLRTGFKLTVAASGDTQTPAVEPVATQAILMEGTAGETIEKYNLVYVDGQGKLRKCASTAVSTADKCVGIAMEGVSSGGALEYMVTGIIQDPNLSTSLGYTPAAGGPLFVGTSGLPTQTSPSTDTSATYVQRTGMALSSAILQINIGAAVVK